MGIVSLLLSIILAAIVVGIAYWAVSMLPLPPPLKTVAQALMILVFLIWLLAIMGLGVATPWRVRI